MIVGTGNVASVLKDREDVTFFASGVSNSGEVNPKAFEREHNLLCSMPKDRHLVYFSSLSIYRDHNAYNVHKRLMEREVKKRFTSYTIVRIEVIAWGKNPTTIHNVFRMKLQMGQPIEIRPTFRYVVDKEEFLYWLSLIRVGEQEEMNIPGTRFDVLKILQMVKEGQL